MKETIRTRARELGFDDCRFTTALPPASSRRFDDWLAAGMHANMGYLERNAHKRRDPDLVLPGARSIIVLATSYHHKPASRSPSEHPKALDEEGPSSKGALEPALVGKVARYASHADYHDVLAPALAKLAAFIDSQSAPPTRSLWYVDTGPILERDLAHRAGLGFIGKHTNLVSRGLGNWFCISEILTTVSIEPDPPEGNHCGKCCRCMDACPTGAIVQPFQLDARRCISYLTIELKGPIPLEFRQAIGSRIYGCDDCLAACPWNRFAKTGETMRHRFRPDLTQPDLLSLLKMDDAGFKKLFEGTPMMRTKRRGVLRNVCVALGNIGGGESLPSLERAAKDPEPLIAEHALWAIEQIKNRKQT